MERTASHILGFVGTEGTGLGFGVEGSYDDYLTGINGRIVRLKSAGGHDMLRASYENYFSAQPGDDLHLTVDANIQRIMERHMNQAVQDFDLTGGGFALAMNPQTGAILGMVSLNDFNPNSHGRLSPERMETLQAQFPDDEEALWEAVRAVAAQALDDFMAMRRMEGEKLRDDVLSRLDLLEELTAKVEARSPALREGYRNRLFAKLSLILEDKQVDESRILTEAAVFAERTDTSEETVRLKSHFEQFRGILTGNEPIGRKLDFLVQELNRESNTIGSKCQDLEISRVVVEMKSEVEKIREQVQNIE